MKKIILLSLFLISFLFSKAQVANVTTIAGSDTGCADGVIGIPAKFSFPKGVATDANGNVYIADTGNNKIRKISPNGIVTTLQNTNFSSPTGICLDANDNVYVADSGNHQIKKITQNGVVSIIAGSTIGYAEGTGTEARFNNPTSVAMDASGNIYVADKDNNLIRKITPNGNVSTFAGSSKGYLDGIGTSAKFSLPSGLVTDASNNVYVVDTYFGIIRKITPTGVVSTFAGSSNPTPGYSDGASSSAKFYNPEGIAIDKNDFVYIADTGNNKVRKITPNGYVTTLAANLSQPSSNTDGSIAHFSEPSGIAIDASGSLFIADTKMHRIRKITSAGEVSSFAGFTIAGYVDGIGTVTKFSSPSGITTDKNGNIYIADSGNFKIRKIAPNGVVSTYAGTIEGHVDDLSAYAKFKYPNDVATDVVGNVYIADSGNNSVRKITSTGVVTTLAGYNQGYVDLPYPEFNSPKGVATDTSGNVYVADTGNNKIRKINQSGVVTTFAGSATYQSGDIDGIGTTARFNNPSGVATDANNNVYVADTGNNKIRKITPTGVVTTIASSSLGIFNQPSDLAIDIIGNIYVADRNNNVIRIITPLEEVYTFAGLNPGSSDGIGTSASFYQPYGIGIDASGNSLYIADSGNQIIRKISLSSLGYKQNFYQIKTVKLYPNPSHDLLNIDIDSFSTTAQIRITDIMGKLIYSNKIETAKTIISTNGYNKGVYFLTLINGNEIETQKFIVN
jgi:sugar lactone lactonase YvrE